VINPYSLQVISLGPQGFGINYRVSEEESKSRKARASNLLEFGSL